jgi:hypothetical protein
MSDPNATAPTPKSGMRNKGACCGGVFSSNDRPKFDTIIKTGTIAGTGLPVYTEEPR